MLRKIYHNQEAEADQTDLVNPNTSVPQYVDKMKKGGYALYHMAGGGPLFLTPDTSLPRGTAAGTTRKSSGDSDSDGSTKAPKLELDWVSGDLMQGERKLAQFNQELNNAIIRYGGDISLAQQDPNVKALNASLTPNPYDVALKKRRKDNFDLQRSYINQENNHRGNQLDIAEIENKYLQTGEIIPITAGMSHKYYENTPIENLVDKDGNSVIGSTWDRQGKIVTTKSDYEAAFKEIYAPAVESLRKSQKPIGEAIIDVIAPDGSEAYRQLKTGYHQYESNQEGLSYVMNQLAEYAGPVIDDQLKQKYLQTHIDEDGKPIMYMSKDGKYTDDYRKFKAKELTDEFAKRLKLTDNDIWNIHSGEFRGYGAGGVETEKDKTDPWRILFDPTNKEAIGADITLPIPSAEGNKAGVVKVPAYAMTDTHREDLDKQDGLRFTESMFNFNNVVKSMNGKAFSLPSDLELGVIVGFGTGFVKTNKAYVDKGKVIAPPEMYVDKNGKTQITKGTEKTVWAPIKMIVTKSDVEKISSNGGGDYYKDEKNPDKLIFAPYQDPSGIFNKANPKLEAIGSIVDITNEQYISTPRGGLNGASIQDNYGTAFGMIDEGIYEITVWAQVPETIVHEVEGKDTRFNPASQGPTPKNFSGSQIGVKKQ